MELDREWPGAGSVKRSRDIGDTAVETGKNQQHLGSEKQRGLDFPQFLHIFPN
jgi:hypothetical protein